MLANKNKVIGKEQSIEDIIRKGKEARQLYEAREALLHDQATLYEEGMEKKAMMIAKALKADGMSDADIAQVTLLSLEQLENLDKE